MLQLFIDAGIPASPHGIISHEWSALNGDEEEPSTHKAAED
jgi:hypothetical protein